MDFFQNESIGGAILCGAVNANIGFAVAPKPSLFVDFSQRGESTARQEPRAHKLNSGFDFAFFPSGADITGDGFKEAIPGEVHEPWVEPDVAPGAGQDHGL